MINLVFEANYGETKSQIIAELINSFVSLKEWSKLAWTYRTVYKNCKILHEKSIPIPCSIHIEKLIEENSDAMKYCLKCIIKLIKEQFQTVESVTCLWGILKKLKEKYGYLLHINKLIIILGCKLFKQSMKFHINTWIHGNMELLEGIFCLIYNCQYDENLHPLRVAATMAFKDIAFLLNPMILSSHECNSNLIMLHHKALKIAIQMISSDNVEIRNYFAEILSNVFKQNITLNWQKSELDQKEEITVQNAKLNEVIMCDLLFDAEEDAIQKFKNPAFTQGYVDLLWEMITNQYFLENEHKNDSKNLVFIYEPANGYLNNINLKLFGLRHLKKITDLKKYISTLKSENQLVFAEIEKNLKTVFMEPKPTTRLEYIKIVSTLIEAVVKNFILEESKEKRDLTQSIFMELAKSRIVDRSVIAEILSIIHY